ALVFAVSEACLDDEVRALDIAELTHALHERIVAAGVQRRLARTEVEKPHARAFRWLLSERASWHRKHARAKRDEEFPTRCHWITSSARRSRGSEVGGPRPVAGLTRPGG